MMTALQEQNQRPTEPPETTPNCDDSLAGTEAAADGASQDDSHTGNGTGAQAQ